jgi:hypothetical protein
MTDHIFLQNHDKKYIKNSHLLKAPTQCHEAQKTMRWASPARQENQRSLLILKKPAFSAFPFFINFKKKRQIPSSF